MTVRLLKAVLMAAALVAVSAVATLAASSETGAGAPAEVTAAAKMSITGSWQGAKLRCRKEEGKAVRCGKPEPFQVIFSDDGTGSSGDEKFPAVFTYRWNSPTEITVSPRPEGDELKLFQLELEEGFLTFQAYIYLPTNDPNLPAEVNYIHYIFDISRSE